MGSRRCTQSVHCGPKKSKLSPAPAASWRGRVLHRVTMALGNQDSFLDGIDRRAFTLNGISWGIPLACFLVLMHTIVADAGYNISWLFQQFAANRKLDRFFNPREYERTLPLIGVVLVVLVSYPIVIMMMWGGAAIATINHLYGMTIILIGLAMVIAWISFMRWQSDSFRLNGAIRIGFIISAFLVVAYQMWVVFTSSYDFVGTSAVFLSFNMLPITNLVFRLAQGTLKKFEKYPSMAQSLRDPILLRGVAAAENAGPSNNGESASKDEKKRVDSRAIREQDVKVDIKSDASGEAKAGAVNGGDDGSILENRNNSANWGLFLLSLLILIAYGTSTTLLAPNRTQGAIGFVTAAAVFTVDTLLLFQVIDFKFRAPLFVVGVMLLTRILLVIFGDKHFFIGHSVVFLLLGAYLGISSINTLIPSMSRRLGMVEFLEKLGIKNNSVEFRELQKDQRKLKLRAVGKYVEDSPFLNWVIQYVDVASLVLGTTLFGMDIVLAATVAGDDFRVPFGSSFRQWVVGVISLVFTLFVVGTFATWRVYSNSGLQLTSKVILVSFLKNAALAGAGGIVFAVSGSYMSMFFFMFCPFILDTAVAFLVEWAQSDFMFPLSGEFRSPPQAPYWWCAFVGRLPKQDYINTGLLFSWFFMVGMMGMAMGLEDPDHYIGWAVPLVLYSLATTCLPIIDWFHTFELSGFIIINSIIAFGTHTLFCTLAYSEVFGSEKNYSTLGLLFYYVMAPFLAMLLFAIIKLRDDKWKLSSEVLAVIVTSVIAFYVFLILATVFFLSIISGFALILLLTVLIIAQAPPDIYDRLLPERFSRCLQSTFQCFQASFSNVKNCAARGDVWVYSIGVLLAVAFAIAVGIRFNDWFLAFSFIWFFVLVCMLTGTYHDFREELGSKRITYMASPAVFPVFRVPEPDSASDGNVIVDNGRVFLIYIECVLIFLWGVLAVYMFRAWVGLGVSSIAICVAYAVTLNFETEGLVALRDAIQVLLDMKTTDGYVSAVTAAQVAAYRANVSDERRPHIDLEHKSTFGQMLDKFKRRFSRGSRSGSRASRTEIDAKGLDSKRNSIAQGEAGSGDAKASLGSQKLGESSERALASGDQDESDTQQFDSEMAEEGILVWQDAQRKKRELLSRIPPIQWGLLFRCSGSDDDIEAKKIIWAIERTAASRQNDGKADGDDAAQNRAKTVVEYSYSRGQALRQADRYGVYERRRYLLHTRFVVQSMVNIIAQAAGFREENRKLQLKMAAERNIDLSEESFAQLPRSSLEYLGFMRAFRQYLRDMELREAAIRRQSELKIRQMEEEKARVAERLARERKEREERERKRAEEAERKMREEEERLEREKKELEREAREAEERRKREAEEARLAMERLEKMMREAREKLKEEEAQKQKEEQKREQKRLEQLRLEKEKQEREARERVERERREAADRKKRTEALKKKQEAERKARQEQKRREEQQQGRRSRSRNLYGPVQDVKGEAADVESDPTGASIRQWGGTEDPEFGPKCKGGKTALFLDEKKPKNPNWNAYKWTRLGNSIRKQGKTPVLFAAGSDPNDIRQGALGDCWFLSAIAVLSQHPDRLKSVFLSKTANMFGVYSLRFFKNDEPEIVCVDDSVPVRWGTTPVFAKSRDPAELWVALLEKAFAKKYACYEAIEGGHVDQALVDMTNGISSRYRMDKPDTKRKINSGVLWSTLMAYQKKGFLMGAGTPPGSDAESNASQWGIVQGHAYSILGLVELDGVQLIQLRNPWGRKEWTGDWSDGSPKWTRRYRALLARQHKELIDQDDGAFYMEFRDFTIHFKDIYICRFFEPKDGWIAKQPLYCRWDESNDGGCTNNTTVSKSPQLHLTCSQKTQIVINMSQEDVRGRIDEQTNKPMKLAAISIEIYANKGRRVSRRIRGKRVCTNPRGYVFTREVTCQVTLPPYKPGFTILTSTFHPGVHRNFTVKVYSDKPITVRALKPNESPR